MRVLDSRRLTGASLWLDRPGAILDVALEGADPAVAEAAWRRAVTPLLAALGWSGAAVAARHSVSRSSFAFTAPIDALYAATEVNEWAWSAAAFELGVAVAPEPIAAAVVRLREAIAREADPARLALVAAAAEHNVTFLADDKRLSVGLGAGSRTWPAWRTPASPERVRWGGLHDVPVALVTGTNGKTTTVRLLGAIARAAGLTAGVTSTDRVTVGAETVAEGDYSGPNGARTVLRDHRVQLAALEVARGGLLRRGLAVPRARVAVVTNVANDHLGEYGIDDVDALADAKLTVAKAVGADGRVVLNADDARLLARGRALTAPVAWFTLEAAHPHVVAQLAAGGAAAWLEGDALVWAAGGARTVVTQIARVPIALGGAARYNVANALAAIAAAAALGLPVEAIRTGIEGFENSPAENPGRANRWNFGALVAIVDFAHNPHGLAALAEMALAIPAKRRAIVLGQAGDRDDDSIRELARGAWAMKPDRTFLKEMEYYRRGREVGAVTQLIATELEAAGAAPASITRHASELDAVRAALTWAEDGDLLLLTTHAERGAVIALMDDLAKRGWQPGQPLDA